MFSPLAARVRQSANEGLAALQDPRPYLADQEQLDSISLLLDFRGEEEAEACSARAKRPCHAATACTTELPQSREWAS
jgi:hypothetical protein